jgi:hypothetical protein
MRAPMDVEEEGEEGEGCDRVGTAGRTEGEREDGLP